MTEIDAMRAINRALTGLDNEEAQVRVLEWAVSKFVAAQFDRLRSLHDEAKAAERDALKGITVVMRAVTEAAARLNVAPLELVALINRLGNEANAEEKRSEES